MSSQRNTIAYVQINGLLARAAAHARHLDESLVAITEGKTICDTSTAARTRGIQRGQSALRARRLCPELLIVPIEQVDAQALTTRLYDLLADISPVLQPAGHNAAFATILPNELPTLLRQAQRAFLGLEAVAATGASKLVARVLVEARVATFDLAPVRFLSPDDPAITGKIERLGLTTMGTVVQIGEEALRYQLGRKTGSLLYRRALGIDDDAVQALWPPPSVYTTRRFDMEPVVDRACLDAFLVVLARQAAGELTDLRRFGRAVTLALETERGRSEHTWRPPWPIQSPAEVVSAARRLLALQPPRAPVIALHLTLAELDLPSAESLSLFDAVGGESRRRLEVTKRLVVARYGKKALTTLGKLPVSLRDRRRELVREALAL